MGRHPQGSGRDASRIPPCRKCLGAKAAVRAGGGEVTAEAEGVVGRGVHRQEPLRRSRAPRKAVNVTSPWRVLRALDAISAIDATGLARATVLLAPSLARILRDLEMRGLILRRSDPADLRTSLLALSPDGRILLDEAGLQSEEIYCRIAARLGEERLETLMRLLHEVEGDLEAPPPDGNDPLAAPTPSSRRQAPSGSST